MSIRKVHQAPAFNRITRLDEIRRLVLEIQKLKPSFEVSVEGHPGLARGRIHHWDVTKKLFSVRWSEINEDFQNACGVRTGLRSFFKVKLFTTQLLFRTELIRRLRDGEYQYRIPPDLFQSQLRKSLRLPLPANQARLMCKQGVFPVLDLSVSGARLALAREQSAELHHLESCILVLGKTRIQSPHFEAILTHRGEDFAGCRFRGLNEALHVKIKQFLVECLHLLIQGAQR